MATPNEVFTEMVVTTLRNHPPKIADAVSEHNALYMYMKEKEKVVTDGGYEIVRNIDFAENQYYQRYNGYGQLDIGTGDVLTAAKYEWVQAAIPITASGRELRLNSGKHAMIKLVNARIDNAKRTIANNMSIDLYSNGAASDQMGGLAHIIQENGQGSVGGINSTTYDFWRNKFLEATGSISTSTIRREMQNLWIALVRGSDKTDLIVSSHDLYNMYWESLDDFQRYNGRAAKAGSNFESLMFKTAEVIFDDNSNFATTAEKMFYLNTDYIELVEHPDANWEKEPIRKSIDQDAEVCFMFWMGQLVTNNRARLGVLVDNS